MNEANKNQRMNAAISELLSSLAGQDIETMIKKAAKKHNLDANALEAEFFNALEVYEEIDEMAY